MRERRTAAAVPSLLSWNMKSGGKRSMFRLTCSISRRVSTPYRSPILVEHHLAFADSQDPFLDRGSRDQLQCDLVLAPIGHLGGECQSRRTAVRV
jgi:hypothetical protein